MNRRQCVKSLTTLASGLAAGFMGAPQRAKGDHENGDSGEWRDRELKSRVITVPPFQGDRYQTSVPDSLDLTDRADLAINAMTRLLNPQYDYSQFTLADLRTSPPVLIMGHGGLVVLNPKWMEALPLARIMTGNRQNLDMDHHLVESVVHVTGRDGLAYQPPEFPGAFYDDFTRARGAPYADMYGEGRQLVAYTVWAQVTSDPLFHRLAERKIGRLLELAVRKGDALYFRLGHGYTPGEKDAQTVSVYAITDHEVMDARLGMVGTAAAHSVGPIAMGAARYYSVTGYEPALILSRGMARYLKNHARLIDESGKWYGWHFHIMTAGILGATEYGVAAQDQEMLRWTQRAYEYGKSIGDPVIGFFAGVPKAEPTDFNPNVRENGMDSGRLETEPCSIADMTIIALKLTRAGLADYYEDVEHYVRNLLVEEQVTNLDFLKTFPQEISGSEKVKKSLESMAPDPKQISTENAAERAVGSFVNSRPNQWYLGTPGPQACGCCLGNATRALYYVWDSILQADGNNLRVNLLLNRASPWADLESHLPYEGKLVLRMKQPRDVLIRIPSWVDRRQVRCLVNGMPREYRGEGSYVRLGQTQKADVVVLQFPVVERTLLRRIKANEYTVVLRGFTVVEMLPRPEVTPLFERDRYRQPQAPMKQVSRFVSDLRIAW